MSHILSEQKGLDDLVQNLGLLKEKAELLSSWLQDWNLFANGLEFQYSEKRHVPFYFSMKNSLCCCNDVSGLMK